MKHLLVKLLAVAAVASSTQIAAAEEVTVLADGARLHSANGLTFDKHGRLVVASVLGNELVRINPFTGAVLGRIGLSEGVDGPDDVTTGPDGSLYFTSLTSGNVVRREPSGATTSQFVAPGVNAITFSSTGRLFVSLDFLGDALYELDPELLRPPRLIAQNLGFMNGMDWGPDGRLYGPIWTQARVVSLDVDSCNGAVDPYVECDIRTAADGFFLPAAVKFDAFGRLHVVDQSGEVYRVNPITGQKKVLAVLPPGLDNLVFDPIFNRLFVSNASDGFVVRLRADGTTKVLSPGGMVAPGGVAALAGAAGADSVFVADVLSLKEFDGATGAELSQTTSFLGISAITTPTNVSADGENLILCSWFGNAVQVWDPGAAQVTESYSFSRPISAIRFQDDLVVTELGLSPGAAQVVRQSGGGVRTTLTAGLSAPAGLAALGGDLWVSDWDSGAIYQLIDDGVELTSPALVAAGLEGPEGVAVDQDGTLLVVEAAAGRLSRIDPATGAVSPVAIGLNTGLLPFTSAPPLYIFSGVTVGVSGMIYVTGDAGNELYRL